MFMTAQPIPQRLATAARFAMLAFLLVSPSPRASGTETTNAFFPVMAWNHVPSDAATFRKMRECGLTVAGFVSPAELDLCQAAGLKAIVSDARASRYDWRNVDEAVARRNIASLVAETGQHPAVYGYYLRDEPGAELFPGLATVSALVRELAPGKWPYINLHPNYANAQQLGTPTYEEHLQRFIDTCKPTRTAPGRVQMVSPYTGRLSPFSGEQQWLAPGQGVLLRLAP
jgi:hypothetical protein